MMLKVASLGIVFATVFGSERPFFLLSFRGWEGPPHLSEASSTRISASAKTVIHTSSYQTEITVSDTNDRIALKPKLD